MFQFYKYWNLLSEFVGWMSINILWGINIFEVCMCEKHNLRAHKTIDIFAVLLETCKVPLSM